MTLAEDTHLGISGSASPTDNRTDREKLEECRRTFLRQEHTAYEVTVLECPVCADKRWLLALAEEAIERRESYRERLMG